MAVTKEQIRQNTSQNNMSNVADIYSLLKESFKDILQKLMEAEMELFADSLSAHIGRLRQKTSLELRNRLPCPQWKD